MGMIVKGIRQVSKAEFVYNLALARQLPLIASMVSTCEEVAPARLRCYVLQVGQSELPELGVGGFAIAPDGELVALHSRVPGMGDTLVRAAIRRGARSLNCFDGYLVSLYERWGFAVDRIEPNDNGSGPMVAYMSLPQEAS